HHLIERCDAAVLLIGGKDDLPLAEETAALSPHGMTILAGRTSLKVTAALIEQSTLFIGNDSGPLHIAAAVGTPAVGIFGPSDWQQFQPVGKQGYRQRVIHSDLPCSPCFRFVGSDPWWYRNPCYSRACLEAISPQSVIAAAVELLEEHARPEGAPSESGRP
ncbi:MAG: glycosyltransferase family 9 protein, partial [Ktedonobacterales bacterium]|nr:glycosyltransferase family 9 protein [Ktedonobacterales bacterium]